MDRNHATRKIIVAVAPVGRNIDLPSKNPLTPEDVAADVVACARAGAALVHLHVRDSLGEQTGDLGDYTRTLDLIRKSSDIVVQGSTGGLTSLSLEERCVALEEPGTEVASLNMGSVNFGEDVYAAMAAAADEEIDTQGYFKITKSSGLFVAGAA